MSDPAMTGTFQIELPQDLVAHAKRTKAKSGKGIELHVEGWRASWMSRLIEKLVGHD